MRALQEAGAAARASALAVLHTNHRTGVDEGFAYDFTCPSPDSYPFQWAWDSCFHAIALCRTDVPRAQREIESLLHAVDSDGFLPHMLLWQKELRAQASRDFRMAVWDGWTSVSLAPPVLARAVERVHAASGDDQWLGRVLPDVQRFYDWLHTVRRTDTGLLAIYHPDESGLDMSPKFDRALGLSERIGPAVAAGWHARMSALLAAYQDGRRPDSDLAKFGLFHWIDVVFNTIYADGLGRLARLSGQVEGPASGAARRFAERADRVSAALVGNCWDPVAGLFYDVDLLAGRCEKVATVSSLFPLVLDRIPDAIADRLIADHLTNPEEFWLPFPVPSVAATEPVFDAVFASGGIFRGSSWINLNWYLYWGLRERGAVSAAATLARRTIEAVAFAGMRECYGPYDATGHGAFSFGWSSLVLDLVAAEAETPSATEAP